MTPDPAVLLSHLAELRDQGLTWRQIHDLHYPGVSFQELNKISRTGRLPQSRKLLRALGLVKKQERTPTEEAIIAMSMMTRQGLRLWKRRKK